VRTSTRTIKVKLLSGDQTVLAEPEPTSMDLRFRLFGVAVRVHPMFWLITALLGWGMMEAFGGFIFLVAWVGCVFASVLLHEFGHVLMGQVFGSYGHIVLHSFGGLAIGSSDVPRRWQRILVLAAGPGIQFLLLLGVYGFQLTALGKLSPEVRQILGPILFMLAWINLFWPLLNLLPIWPLDGGQISRELCEGASPRNGTIIALTLSAVLSGFLAVHVLLSLLYYRSDAPLLEQYHQTIGRYINPYLRPSMFLGLFFAMFAVNSVQVLQAEKRQRRGYYDDDLPWER
jgi:Zn-dependent protease